jgi:hypothetical protein
VFVKDPSDELRLGMPATVYLPLDQGEVGSASRAGPRGAARLAAPTADVCRTGFLVRPGRAGKPVLAAGAARLAEPTEEGRR